MGLGVTFLDFSADSTDSPLRAYLLDVCNPNDQDTALNIHAILGGSGAALGFVMAAIDWNHTFLSFIGDELQILWIFAFVLFIVGLVMTLTSVKETPIILIKSNNERMPLVGKLLLFLLTHFAHLVTIMTCRRNLVKNVYLK